MQIIKQNGAHSTCNKKFFSEATEQTYVHNELAAREHVKSTGHIVAPDYAHTPVDVKRAPYFKDAEALAKRHGGIGKGKELKELLNQIR